MNNSTEQWLTDGRCDLCRRKDYCKKVCGGRKRAKKRFNLEMQKMMMKSGQDIAANMRRAEAAAGAFRRACAAKNIHEAAVSAILDRCRKLAQVSDQPQYVYIEAHLENLQKGTMTQEDFMASLENAHREQPYMGIDGKPIDDMMAMERRLQALENAYDESGNNQ